MTRAIMSSHRVSLLKIQIIMFGQPLKHLGETASTNDDAANWARADEPSRASHGSVVRADSQTRGRGRLGREWVSPANLGLYFSIVLRPENLEIARVPQLTMVAALSCAWAIEEVSGLRAHVKWPNDVILHGRKIGGILSEAHASNIATSSTRCKSEVDFAVVGIGLNVDFSASDLPQNLKIPATSLRMESGDVGKSEKLFAAILRSFERNYQCFMAGEWTNLRDEFARRDILQNQNVRVETANETFRGVVRGMNDDGVLCVQTENGAREVVAGDVIPEE